MNQGAVKLRRYIEARGLSPARFASLIFVTQPSVHRYLYGRIPSPPVMQQIKAVTEGEISPNDWLTPLDEPKAKKKAEAVAVA